jgi:hypothetical protein
MDVAKETSRKTCRRWKVRARPLVAQDEVALHVLHLVWPHVSYNVTPGEVVAELWASSSIDGLGVLPVEAVLYYRAAIRELAAMNEDPGMWARMRGRDRLQAWALTRRSLAIESCLIPSGAVLSSTHSSILRPASPGSISGSPSTAHLEIHLRGSSLIY